MACAVCTLEPTAQRRCSLQHGDYASDARTPGVCLLADDCQHVGFRHCRFSEGGPLQYLYPYWQPHLTPYYIYTHQDHPSLDDGISPDAGGHANTGCHSCFLHSLYRTISECSSLLEECKEETLAQHFQFGLQVLPDKYSGGSGLSVYQPAYRQYLLARGCHPL